MLDRQYVQQCLLATIGKIKAMPVSEISAEMDLVYELNVDSLDMQEMIIVLADDYGIVIQERDIAGLRTVGDIAAHWQ